MFDEPVFVLYWCTTPKSGETKNLIHIWYTEEIIRVERVKENHFKKGLVS